MSLIEMWINSRIPSPVMGKEPPFVIKNIHVYDSKSADKNLERKANPTAKELKNESIISSKRKLEVFPE